MFDCSYTTVLLIEPDLFDAEVCASPFSTLAATCSDEAKRTDRRKTLPTTSRKNMTRSIPGDWKALSVQSQKQLTAKYEPVMFIKPVPVMMT